MPGDLSVPPPWTHIPEAGEGGAGGIPLFDFDFWMTSHIDKHELEDKIRSDTVASPKEFQKYEEAWRSPSLLKFVRTTLDKIEPLVISLGKD